MAYTYSHIKDGVKMGVIDSDTYLFHEHPNLYSEEMYKKALIHATTDEDDEDQTPEDEEIDIRHHMYEEGEYDVPAVDEDALKKKLADAGAIWKDSLTMKILFQHQMKQRC